NNGSCDASPQSSSSSNSISNVANTTSSSPPKKSKSSSTAAFSLELRIDDVDPVVSSEIGNALLRIMSGVFNYPIAATPAVLKALAMVAHKVTSMPCFPPPSSSVKKQQQQQQQQQEADEDV